MAARHGETRALRRITLDYFRFSFAKAAMPGRTNSNFGTKQRTLDRASGQPSPQGDQLGIAIKPVITTRLRCGSGYAFAR